jgi:hypothetical protein
LTQRSGRALTAEGRNLSGRLVSFAPRRCKQFNDRTSWVAPEDPIDRHRDAVSTLQAFPRKGWRYTGIDRGEPHGNWPQTWESAIRSGSRACDCSAAPASWRRALRGSSGAAGSESGPYIVDCFNNESRGHHFWPIGIRPPLSFSGGRAGNPGASLPTAQALNMQAKSHLPARSVQTEPRTHAPAEARASPGKGDRSPSPWDDGPMTPITRVLDACQV